MSYLGVYDRMNRTASMLIACLVFALVAAGPARAAVVDQVVATVDTEAILLSEIMAELQPEIQEMQAQAPDAQTFTRALDERVRKTVDQAIESKILYREAAIAGLEIPEDVVEERLQELKKLYDTNEAFLQDLEKAGETVGDLRVRLRKQMLARAMGMRKMNDLEKSVVVSESDVAQYYQDHQDEFTRPDRVRCRQIFLPKEAGGPEPAVIRARLEEITKDLEAGASFAELAEAFSQGAGAKDGGLIGWVVRGAETGKGDLVKPLEDVVFATGEGALTGIVETDYGFHLVKVEKKESAGLASLEEVRKEIEPILRRQAAGELYDKWMAELRKRSRVRRFL